MKIQGLYLMHARSMTTAKQRLGMDCASSQAQPDYSSEPADLPLPDPTPFHASGKQLPSVRPVHENDTRYNVMQS
jgi:hypothetical protein